MRIIFLLAALLLCTALHAQQDRTVTIMSGGVERSFVLHLPSDNVEGDPVILCFHGTGGTAASIMAVAGFHELGEIAATVFVYPQALVIGNDRQWNVYVDDQPGHGGLGVVNAPDDVLFTRDIIEYLSTNYSINRERVYATGLSNGGFMCYALSLLASDVISGIAPVAANMWSEPSGTFINQLIASGTVEPMPVMHVHGTADNIVPYPDPDNTPKDYEEYPLFIPARVCGAVTYSDVQSEQNNVDRLVFCSGPVPVWLIRITGMGHSWTDGSYQTSFQIMGFFGLSTLSVDQQLPAAGFSVTPTVTANSVRVEFPVAATVRVISPTGAVVYEADGEAGSFDLSCADLAAGLYLVHFVGRSGEPSITRRIIVMR